VAVTIPVLMNDSDPDGDALTVISVSPNNGTRTSLAQMFLFTPTGNFIGTRYGGLRHHRRLCGTNSAADHLSVTNRQANSQSIATTFNTAKAITCGSDLDGDALTFIIAATRQTAC